MYAAPDHTTLDKLPIGTRLVVRSRKDWRFAAVSRVSDDRVVLTVCSPSGRTYRLWRDLDCSVMVTGVVPVLDQTEPEDWRENFCCYDTRW
jgi:hypothetical protein